VCICVSVATGMDHRPFVLPTHPYRQVLHLTRSVRNRSVQIASLLHSYYITGKARHQVTLHSRVTLGNVVSWQ
jgi:hypothetical protein